MFSTFFVGIFFPHLDGAIKYLGLCSLEKDTLDQYFIYLSTMEIITMHRKPLKNKKVFPREEREGNERDRERKEEGREGERERDRERKTERILLFYTNLNFPKNEINMQKSRD
jgi:hypothetical protein